MHNFYALHIYLYHHCTGTVLEGPSNVTYLPGLTMLPIELICDVTGIPIWRINSSVYLPADLFNGVLAGHNSSGTNILVNSPVNNTKYVCVSQTINGNINSNPAYIFVAGKSDKIILNMIACMCMFYASGDYNH